MESHNPVHGSSHHQPELNPYDIPMMAGEISNELCIIYPSVLHSKKLHSSVKSQFFGWFTLDTSESHKIPIWVCLKIKYTPCMATSIGNMMTNHQTLGYTIFRQTHLKPRTSLHIRDQRGVLR